MAFEQFVVARRDTVPRLDLVGEDRQLLDQDRGLDSVQARVHPDAHVEVFGVVFEGAALDVAPGRLAVNPKGIDHFGQLGVVGQYSATVAVAAERLGRKKLVVTMSAHLIG